MKKISLVLLLVLLFSVFSSCGTGEDTKSSTVDTSSPETTLETTQENDIVRIAIDKNSLADPESFIQSMESYGAEVKDVTTTGGYLLLFSKDEHSKLLKDKKAEVLKKFKEYEENGEHYVDSIEYDDDFRNLKIYVNKSLYESTGSTTGNVVVASAALSYQMYLEEGQKTVVNIIYSGTEDIVSTFTLPMNLSVAQ